MAITLYLVLLKFMVNKCIFDFGEDNYLDFEVASFVFNNSARFRLLTTLFCSLFESWFRAGLQHGTLKRVYLMKFGCFSCEFGLLENL